MVWVKGRWNGSGARGTRGSRSEGSIVEPAAAASRQGSFGRFAARKGEGLADIRPIERNFRWLGLLVVWQSFSFDLAMLVEASDDF